MYQKLSFMMLITNTNFVIKLCPCDKFDSCMPQTKAVTPKGLIVLVMKRCWNIKPIDSSLTTKLNFSPIIVLFDSCSCWSLLPLWSPRFSSLEISYSNQLDEPQGSIWLMVECSCWYDPSVNMSEGVPMTNWNDLQGHSVTFLANQ